MGASALADDDAVADGRLPDGAGDGAREAAGPAGRHQPGLQGGAEGAASLPEGHSAAKDKLPQVGITAEKNFLSL